LQLVVDCLEIDRQGEVKSRGFEFGWGIMLSDRFVPRGGEKWRGGGPTPYPLPVGNEERIRERERIEE